MKNTIAYSIIYALTDNNIITSDNIEWKKEKGGKVTITDNNKYQVIFDLQNSVKATSTYDINSDDALAKDERTNLHQHNYVALMKDDKSIVQIWGKKDRAIIEIRKHLYEALECENVKMFRECKKNTYKNIERKYQLVVDIDTFYDDAYNKCVNESVKLITDFLKRLEKKTKGENTNETENTNASEKTA